MKTKFTHLKDTEVLETKEYSVFTLEKKNRPVDRSKVVKFIQAFKQGRFYMKEFPAIVSEDFVILDGQHRYEAVRELGLPFYFRFTSKLTIDNVVDVQSNAGWKPKDFLHTFVQQGKQDYIVLQRFVERYQIPVSTAINLLYGSQQSQSIMNSFYSGDFKVRNEDAAHKLIKMAKDFEANGFSDYRSRNFLSALKSCSKHPDYNHKKMIERLAKYGRSLFFKQVTTELYIRSLENLYNYRNTEKIRFVI